MLIRLGYELIFNAPAPVPMMALLFGHPSRAATFQQPDRLRSEPWIAVSEFTDWFGNRCTASSCRRDKRACGTTPS